MTTLLNHPPLLAAVLFLMLMIVIEAGFRLATWTGANLDDARREQIAASRDALGILLSLLLAFTLAMALPRFDLRRQLVMEEANAIGTTALRTSMLPDADQVPVRALLLQYIHARRAYSQSSPSEPAFASAIELTKKLQSALWQQAEQVARQNPTPISALFIVSLNETIDLSEKRLNALENRIPVTVWFMLSLLAFLTSLTFGYGQRKRFWLVTIISPLMIAVVMGLIADLDSPRSGFLRVDLRSLNRLAHDLETGSVIPSDAHPPAH